jgi:endonuclease/exonuclease/phosphatase family metal-dependent hydrolase
MHGQELHLLITHLTRRKTRKDQLKTVVEMFLDIDPPVVLMGDLNTLPTDPQIGSLLSTPGVVEPLIDVLGDQTPTRRVDWIFVRGLEVVDAGIIDKGASDHPCVWAELRLTRQPTRDSTVNKPD